MTVRTDSIVDVEAGNGDQTAIIWDSPVTKSKRKITYKELLKEVETFAGVLREEGVKKGDVVLIYMPMIPAALIGILAVSNWSELVDMRGRGNGLARCNVTESRYFLIDLERK
jgi:long-subunit acyl-CoA synthetase (AMP-forming)